MNVNYNNKHDADRGVRKISGGNKQYVMSVLIFQRCQSHVSSTDGGFAEYVSIPSQMPARHHESQIILGNGEKLKFLQSKLKVTSEEISLESLLIISDFVSPPRFGSNIPNSWKAAL